MGATGRLFLLGALVAMVTLTVHPGGAWACSCDVPPEVADEYEQASAVFSGQVVGTRDTGDSPMGQPEHRVATFEVDGVWKGDVAELVDVATAWDGGMCGLGFDVGQRWLLYASGSGDDGYRAYDCGRSVYFESASEDLAEIGEPSRPMAGEQRRPASWPWWVPWAAGLAVAGTAVVVGAYRHST